MAVTHVMGMIQYIEGLHQTKGQRDEFAFCGPGTSILSCPQTLVLLDLRTLDPG